MYSGSAWSDVGIGSDQAREKRSIGPSHDLCSCRPLPLPPSRSSNPGTVMGVEVRRAERSWRPLARNLDAQKVASEVVATEGTAPHVRPSPGIGVAEFTNSGDIWDLEGGNSAGLAPPRSARRPTGLYARAGDQGGTGSSSPGRIFTFRRKCAQMKSTLASRSTISSPRSCRRLLLSGRAGGGDLARP